MEIIIEIVQNVEFGKNNEFVLAPGTRLPAQPGDKNFAYFVRVGQERVGILRGEFYVVGGVPLVFTLSSGTYKIESAFS